MASQHPYPPTGNTGKLLSTKEHKICLQYCAADDEVTRKRAKALLALDKGCTQVRSGELSGLTRGQINYLVTLFRKKGMALFTQEPPPDTSQPDSPVEKSSIGKAAEKDKKGKKKKKKKKEKKASTQKKSPKNATKEKKKRKKKKKKK